MKISDQQLRILCHACLGHDRGNISAEPTIGCCWDADRLDLPRVHVRVDKQYLSTQAAKEMI